MGLPAHSHPNQIWVPPPPACTAIICAVAWTLNFRWLIELFCLYLLVHLDQGQYLDVTQLHSILQLELILCIKKVTHWYTSQPEITKITWYFQIFLDMSQFWLNLGNFCKVDPFMSQILHKIKGHWYTRRLILLPMFAAHPCRIFCTKYRGGLLWSFHLDLASTSYCLYIQKTGTNHFTKHINHFDTSSRVFYI